VAPLTFTGKQPFVGFRDASFQPPHFELSILDVRPPEPAPLPLPPLHPSLARSLSVGSWWADHELDVRQVMKGLYKAKRNGLIDMKNFDLEVCCVCDALCDTSGQGVGARRRARVQGLHRALRRASGRMRESAPAHGRPARACPAALAEFGQSRAEPVHLDKQPLTPLLLAAMPSARARPAACLAS